MKVHYVLGLTAMLALPLAQADEAPAAPAAPPVHAQGMPEGSDMTLGQADLSDVDDLKLTADQKQKLQVIRKEADAKHDAIRVETRNKIKFVLTPEQFKQLEAHQKQRMERREDRKERRQERREDRREKMKERHMEKTQAQ